MVTLLMTDLNGPVEIKGFNSRLFNPDWYPAVNSRQSTDSVWWWAHPFLSAADPFSKLMTCHDIELI